MTKGVRRMVSEFQKNMDKLDKVVASAVREHHPGGDCIYEAQGMGQVCDTNMVLLCRNSMYGPDRMDQLGERFFTESDRTLHVAGL